MSTPTIPPPPCFVFQLRALQRPVAALQLYVRLVVAGWRGGAGTATASTSATAAAAAAEARSGGGLINSHQLVQQQQQQQQEQRNKRALREASLMSAFRELCWRYPDAARVAARWVSFGRSGTGGGEGGSAVCRCGTPVSLVAFGEKLVYVSAIW